MQEDHDPDESPLVQLPCGHVFMVETLDGLMEMHRFYGRDGDEGPWTTVLVRGGWDGALAAAAPATVRGGKGRRHRMRISKRLATSVSVLP